MNCNKCRHRIFALLLGLLLAAGCGRDARDLSESPVADEIRRLREGEPMARESAAAALGKETHPEALPALVGAARTDHQPRVRIAAIRSLAAYPADEVGGELVELLEADAEAIRLAAAQALGRLRWKPAAEALAERHRTDPSPAVRQSSLASLGATGGEAFDLLVRRFPELASEEQTLVFNAVLENGENHARADLLIAALEARAAALRIRAAEALAIHGDETAVPALVRLAEEPLGEADEAVRKRRLEQGPTRFDIQQIKVHFDEVRRRTGGHISPGMHDWLERDEERAATEFAKLVERQRTAEIARVRESVAGALLGIGEATAMEALQDMITSERREFAGAARAAFRNAGAEGLDALYGVVADSERPREVRLQAMDLLASGDVSAEKKADRGWDPAALRGAITAPVPREQAEMDAGEARLRDALAERLADVDEKLAAQAALHLLRRGDARGQALVLGILNGDDPNLRLEAISVLGKHGGPEAVGAVLSRLEKTEENAERMAALEALGRMGDATALDAVLALALENRHPVPLRRAALSTLGDIGDPRPGPALAELHARLDRERPDQWRRLMEDILVVAGRIESMDMVPTLVAEVDAYASFGPVREAMRALGRIGDRSAFESLDAALRKRPLRTVHDVDQVADDFGIPALVDLGDPRGIDTLLYLIRRKDGGVNTPATAIRALAGFEEDRASKVLVGLLADPSIGPALQEAAVGPAVLDLGSRAIPELDRLLRETPAPDNPAGVDPGMYAVELLAHLGEEGVETLFVAVGESDALPRHVLGRLIEVMKRVGATERALLALVELAAHEDARVRQWSVSALGAFPQPRAREALEKALEDEDEAVRRWAAEALERQRTRPNDEKNPTGSRS
ncbi:MAG: HEAT repeat domain-containing protein [Verrucomicrobia bacterium]|nr:HEAT repeat domain-containing protein [Verrucomicrobiota bacterium]MCH8511475.1 HEAT repeat domain-containing protein [Kiritimatiellia bacterium]